MAYPKLNSEYHGNVSPTIRSRDTKGKEMPHKTELTFGSWVKLQHHKRVWAPGRVSFCPLVLRNFLLH